MIKMAFRNIFRQKRRSLLTTLTMFGGFVLASLALGVIDGTYNRIVDEFTRSRMGHIQIHARGYLERPTLQKVIRNGREIGVEIDRSRDAEAWAPRIIAAALASVGERTDTARILGIDPVRENAATRFERKITRELFSGSLEGNHSRPGFGPGAESRDWRRGRSGFSSR